MGMIGERAACGNKAIFLAVKRCSCFVVVLVVVFVMKIERKLSEGYPVIKR
jgi:hypothetical protein